LGGPPRGPRMPDKGNYDRKKVLSRLIKYFKPYKITIAIVAVFVIISELFALYIPLYVGEVVDYIGFQSTNFDKVAYYSLSIIVFQLVSSILGYAYAVLMTVLSRRILVRMRNQIFDKLSKVPVKYYDKTQTGDILSVISYDLGLINTSITHDIVLVVKALMTVTFSFVMILDVSFILVLIILITIPISVLITRTVTKKTRVLFMERSKNFGSMNGYAEEYINGLFTTKAYNAESVFLQEFNALNEKAFKSTVEAERYQSSLGPLTNLANNLSLILMCIVGGYMYMQQMLTLSDITISVLYCRKFSGPINEIANLWGEMQSSLSAANRVFTLLDTEEEVADTDKPDLPAEVRGKITFKDVNFGYVPNVPVLQNASFEVESGKTVAIVGKTGAGKTTLINLLMRFYDIDSGSILIDDQDMYSFNKKSLRKTFSMVLQDTWLFDGTIFQNIRYGNPDATFEEVVQSAKDAKIHDFIMSLPNQYETNINEDGGNISKGQKQLLTIARAMLVKAGILILDEATSNVDVLTEKRIQQAMLKLMGGKTCFVVAHRLSTIRNADLILVMDNGNIIEQGNHHELLRNKGYYHKLYCSQFYTEDE
ncbi:MAG: ABC transporter ATP-binding protein, partial [Bacillota bacterium]